MTAWRMKINNKKKVHIQASISYIMMHSEKIMHSIKWWDASNYRAFYNTFHRKFVLM
jgi:hypothetical protein